MKVTWHDDEYFNETPVEKQRVCCNCRHRVLIEGSKCELDGHHIGYIECFSQWCIHWATDEARWKENTDGDD